MNDKMKIFISDARVDAEPVAVGTTSPSAVVRRIAPTTRSTTAATISVSVL